jgi:hypothetical protein
MALDCILKRQPLFPYYCSEFSSDRAMFQTFANTGQTGCMFWVSDMSSGHLNLITTVYIHLKKQFLHHLQQVVQVGCLFLFIFPKVLHLLSCKKTPYDLLYCRCDFYVQILLGSRNKKRDQIQEDSWCLILTIHFLALLSKISELSLMCVSLFRPTGVAVLSA